VIYWGTRSGDYSENSDYRGHIVPADTTTYQITGLLSSVPYFFAVKAVSDLGPSSDYSDEAAIPAILGLKNEFELSVCLYETYYLSGIAAADKPVEVFFGLTRLGSTVAGPDGAWSLPVNGTLLEEGTAEFSASSTGAQSEPIPGTIRILSAPYSRRPRLPQRSGSRGCPNRTPGGQRYFRFGFCRPGRNRRRANRHSRRAFYSSEGLRVAGRLSFTGGADRPPGSPPPGPRSTPAEQIVPPDPVHRC